MSKVKFTFALMVLALGAGLSFAAAPQLPEKAIGSETIMLVHLDGATLTPDALRQAAGTVLGDRNAATVNQQIAKFQEKYDKAVKAGVQSLTFVGAVDSGAKPDAARKDDSASQGIGYIQLKPGADAAAVQKLITEQMDADQQGKMVFSREGNFLVMRDKNEQPPAAGDRARAGQFSEAINQASAAGMVIAFVPNQNLRDKYQKDGQAGIPPMLQQMMPAVLNSKWATIAINVGNSPAIVITDSAADDASAKQLVDGVNAALAQLKQAARGGGQNAQAGNNPLMMFAPMLAPLADALKPSQAGNKVTVSLQGPALQSVAQMGMGFAAMMGNMGGPAAGPGRGGRSPAGAPAGRGQ